MDENNSSTDHDDAEILAKFRNLLNKYQGQDKLASAADNTAEPSVAMVFHPDSLLREAESDQIPVLTEVVMLYPSVIQPQPKRSTPIRQILDAALDDTHIEMSITDRKALASALETRLVNQVK